MRQQQVRSQRCAGDDLYQNGLGCNIRKLERGAAFLYGGHMSAEFATNSHRPLLILSNQHPTIDGRKTMPFMASAEELAHALDDFLLYYKIRRPRAAAAAVRPRGSAHLWRLSTGCFVVTPSTKTAGNRSSVLVRKFPASYPESFRPFILRQGLRLLIEREHEQPLNRSGFALKSVFEAKVFNPLHQIFIDREV